MIIIRADGVADAWYQASRIVWSGEHMERRMTRAGEVFVAEVPVMTVYSNPMDRVLTCPIRDANPFFHLSEALWMLAGRNDATFLDNFVSDFSQRFAQSDGRQHGAYGHRWRSHWSFDQLEECVARIKKNPSDRRVVLTMWDPEADLREQLDGETLRDLPCNTQIYLKVRDGALDITVLCRSNDIVWGCYGANAVHFSILHEYLAKRSGLPVGVYRHYSDDWHVYLNTLSRVPSPREILSNRPIKSHTRFTPLITHPKVFTSEICTLLDLYEENTLEANLHTVTLLNETLRRVFGRMLVAHSTWKQEDSVRAIEILNRTNRDQEPWIVAAREWLQRRGKRVLE